MSTFHGRARNSLGAVMAFLAALVLLQASLAVPRADAFTLYFDTSAYSGEMWLQIQDPLETFQATYSGGAETISFDDQGTRVLMSVPVKLSDIGAGGLDITHSQSAVFFIYYDDPSGNSRTAAPAHMVSTQRFQPFELTMMDGSGDQGNLTAINYFTAPLGIRSYENDPMQNPSEPVLQQTGFGSATAAEIGAVFATATAGNQDAVITNGKGQVVRYIGPSNYNGANPWPSFIPYTQSINQAGQSTEIKRSNGFNFPAPDDTPVYQFGCDMQATANADGSVTVTGDITVSVNAAIKAGNPPLPQGGVWSNATFTFSVNDVDDFNNAIYGQVATDAVSFAGQAWSDFETFTKNTLQDPSLPYDQNTNPSLYDTPFNAYTTTVGMFIGEVTTGLLGGFFNSDYEVQGVAIKDMYSNQWWSLDPIVAFSTLQPDNEYYNIYAEVIFDKSGNTVYGVPYSDRFGQGPLVNTVEYEGTPVNYWVVDIGAPLAAGQATMAPALLLLKQQDAQ